MKKKNVQRALALALAATMLAGTVAGCGKSSDSDSTQGGKSSNGKYAKELTIDVFDSQANFQGEQTGWFAKLIKDKFNIKLNIIAPNVAGGGDTLYQTRSANGNLGDLIITNLDSSRLKDMVTAGLVLDMSDYIKDEKYLQDRMDAINTASKLSGTDGGQYRVKFPISRQLSLVRHLSQPMHHLFAGMCTEKLDIRKWIHWKI